MFTNIFLPPGSLSGGTVLVKQLFKLVWPRKDLKWHRLAHHQLMSQQGPHYSPLSKAKAIIVAQISGEYGN